MEWQLQDWRVPRYPCGLTCSFPALTPRESDSPRHPSGVARCRLKYVMTAAWGSQHKLACEYSLRCRIRVRQDGVIRKYYRELSEKEKTQWRDSQSRGGQAGTLGCTSTDDNPDKLHRATRDEPPAPGRCGIVQRPARPYRRASDREQTDHQHPRRRVG